MEKLSKEDYSKLSSAGKAKVKAGLGENPYMKRFSRPYTGGSAAAVTYYAKQGTGYAKQGTGKKRTFGKFGSNVNGTAYYEQGDSSSDQSVTFPSWIRGWRATKMGGLTYFATPIYLEGSKKEDGDARVKGAYSGRSGVVSVMYKIGRKGADGSYERCGNGFYSAGKLHFGSYCISTKYCGRIGRKK